MLDLFKSIIETDRSAIVVCDVNHYIRANALEQIVIFELKRLAIMLQQDEKLFAEILEKKTNKDFYDEKKHLEEQLQKAIVR